MKEVLIRSLTGLVYILFVVAAALAGPFTTGLLFLPVLMVAAWEMHRLYWPDDDGPPGFWSVLTSLMLYLTIAMAPLVEGWSVSYPLGIGLLILFLSISWLLFRGSAKPMHDLGGRVLMLCYLPPAFALATVISAQDPLLFIGAMILMWTSDTGAYVFGRSIGRTPLLPTISPNKTIEGAVGGLASTLLASWVVWTFFGVLDLEQWLMGGMIIFGAGLLGDLLESAFKRAANVKDSGSILPGHGGILDRFDGYLLAVPAFWAYLRTLV